MTTLGRLVFFYIYIVASALLSSGVEQQPCPWNERLKKRSCNTDRSNSGDKTNQAMTTIDSTDVSYTTPAEWSSESSLVSKDVAETCAVLKLQLRNDAHIAALSSKGNTDVAVRTVHLTFVHIHGPINNYYHFIHDALLTFFPLYKSFVDDGGNPTVSQVVLWNKQNFSPFTSIFEAVYGLAVTEAPCKCEVGLCAQVTTDHDKKGSPNLDSPRVLEGLYPFYFDEAINFVRRRVLSSSHFRRGANSRLLPPPRRDGLSGAELGDAGTSWLERPTNLGSNSHGRSALNPGGSANTLDGAEGGSASEGILRGVESEEEEMAQRLAAALPKGVGRVVLIRRLCPPDSPASTSALPASYSSSSSSSALQRSNSDTTEDVGGWVVAGGRWGRKKSRRRARRRERARRRYRKKRRGRRRLFAAEGGRGNRDRHPQQKGFKASGAGGGGGRETTGGRERGGGGGASRERSRSSSAARQFGISNHHDLLAALEHRFGRRRVVSVVLERLSFAEQVRVFGEAQVVIGQHGAGLANVLFAMPSALLLEICPRLHGTYQHLANHRRVAYEFHDDCGTSADHSRFAFEGGSGGAGAIETQAPPRQTYDGGYDSTMDFPVVDVARVVESVEKHLRRSEWEGPSLF